MGSELTARQRRLLLAVAPDPLWQTVEQVCQRANSRARPGARKADKLRPTPTTEALEALHAVGLAEYKLARDGGDPVVVWRLTDAAMVLAAELVRAGVSK